MALCYHVNSIDRSDFEAVCACDDCNNVIPCHCSIPFPMLADDWPEGNWWSSDSFTVQPGDVIFASLSYVKASNAYEMVISNNNKAGAVIKSLRPVIDNQVYTDVYFVTEHQPDSCTEYPANGGIVFSNIIIAWDNQQATPQWSAHQFQPACNSQAHILSSSSVSFTWSTS